MTTLVQLKQVSKVYSGHTAVVALHPTDFTLHAGEFAAVIGPSGSGKTTLLTIIGNLQQPSDGQIVINSQDTTHFNERQRTDLRFNTFGFILQASNLIPFLTVKDQLALVDRFNHHRQHKRSMTELFNLLGISDLTTNYPSALSGGEKQRVAIARALCMEPQVLLFDEPTSALDPQMVGDILKIIKHLALKGMTMIIVTHEMQFARDVSNKVIFMHNGIIEEAGTPEQIFEHPRSMGMIQFLSRQY
jgi:putative ABC transport system ATP-binding protein